jgi:histidinol-phosphatase (PHP family)
MRTQRYPQEVVNLHTHSFYCGHGQGEISEFVTAAKEADFAVLGFSEHCPLPDDRYRSSRMAFGEQSSYERDILAHRGDEELLVLLGYECDYHAEYEQYFQELTMRVDYLIAGVHFLNEYHQKDQQIFSLTMDAKDLHFYADLYCRTLQSGHFLYGVHPDAFAYCYRRWDSEAEAVSRAIIECAVSMGVGLEINGNGVKKQVIRTADGGMTHAYPSTEFWRIASEYPLKVVTASDAHDPDHIRYGLDTTGALAAELGITFASFEISEQGVRLV